MALVALDTARSVDRTLAQPGPVLSLQIRAVGVEQARLLLESQVAHQTGFYLEAWAIAQILMGGMLFFFLLFGTGEGKYTLTAALLMLVSVLGQQVLLMPGLSSLAHGNTTAFSAEAVATLAEDGYWAMEVAKMTAGLALAMRLVRRKGTSGQTKTHLEYADGTERHYASR